MQMHTYTDQLRHKHIQVLSKKTAYLKKYSGIHKKHVAHTHTYIQTHARTANKQNEHSKRRKILLWENQLNL